MRRTQISMTDEQADALRRLAAVRQRSQAALLREALDVVLHAEGRTRHVERARAVAGAFSSGTRSTSTEHDAVLEDAYRG